MLLEVREMFVSNINNMINNHVVVLNGIAIGIVQRPGVHDEVAYHIT